MPKNEKFFIKDIIDALKNKNLFTESSTYTIDDAVANVTYNSKEANADTLFVCKGINFKPEYFDEAVTLGTRWFVSEKKFDNDTVKYIIVNDIRKTLSVISAYVCGYKKEDIDLCAFVGTKGKSSSVYFLVNILNAAGRKTAYTTTIDVCDGGEPHEGFLTTPESLELHHIIKRSIENGCEYMLMEVSSMAEKMQRVYSLSFKYGAFANISPDHISKFEHKDFNEYFSYKRSILKRCENLAVNIDDPHSSDVLSDKGEDQNIVTFSTCSDKADIYVTNVVKDGFMRDVTIHTPSYDITLELSVPGAHNVMNVAAAVSVAYMMKIPAEYIVSGIKGAFVPGRMETINYNGYTVIADYAHNKASMSGAIKTLKEDYPDKKIKVLFGCSGNKVPQRREDMACESSKGASYVYITSDNPSYDDPEKIAAEIKEHLDAYGCKNEIIIDRQQAVKKAVQELESDEILLLAGKGREHYQVVQGKITPYGGDTVLAEKYLKEFKK